MNDRFQALVYGTVFAVFVGWVLYIGQDILVPIVFSVLVMYVIIGSARFLARLPVIGPALPVYVHYGLSTLAILVALLLLGWLTMDSVDALVARHPTTRRNWWGWCSAVACCSASSPTRAGNRSASTYWRR